MAASDLYCVLGVAPNASSDEIRTAYRKQALRTHPDRAVPERKEQSTRDFKIVAEAYEVLSDPQRRREYDSRYDAAAAGPSSAQRFNGMHADPIDSPFSNAQHPPRAGGFPPAGFGFQFQDPFQMFNALFAEDMSSGGGGGGSGGQSHQAFFPPLPTTFGRQDPFFSNHFAMAGMGFGSMGPPRAQRQQHQQGFGFDELMAGGPMASRFGASAGGFRSSSFQSSSMTAGGKEGVQHHSSRSTYTTHRNGRSETVTKEVAADGTETIHRVTDDGESVTVNGLPQSSHPLLRSSARTGGGCSSASSQRALPTNKGKQQQGQGQDGDLRRWFAPVGEK